MAFERARVTVPLADAGTTLEDVERALAELSAGTYGYCEDCGAEIPPARLDA